MDYKILLISIIIVLTLTLYYLDVRNTKNKIRKFLIEKGYKEIEIHFNLFSGKKGSFIFDVEYTDAHALKAKYTCRIDRHLFSDNKFHWQKKPMIQH